MKLSGIHFIADEDIYVTEFYKFLSKIVFVKI
jgi:hypothetical protein